MERSIAVIGAGGTMAQGMIRNLLDAGFAVRAWNRSPEKIAHLESEQRASVASTPADAAEGTDVILTMLSDAGSVLAVMERDDGVIAGATPGAVWVQASTIGVEGADRCVELANRAGLTLFDAPVLGSKEPAEAGTLVVLASGPETARGQVEPVFDAIGSRTLWVGEAGAGSRLKLAVNSWVLTVVEGGAEMLALAGGLGLDPRHALEAIAGGPFATPYLDDNGKTMLAGDFETSFRLALAAKDAGLVDGAARDAGLELPVFRAIAERMAAGADLFPDEDFSATYKLATRKI